MPKAAFTLMISLLLMSHASWAQPAVPAPPTIDATGYLLVDMDSDGDLLEEGSYELGFKQGRWRELHDGRLVSGRYDGGKRVGPWADKVGDTLIEKLIREKLGDHPILKLR